MWTRKVQRDRKKGVDSPVPTQVVSNEEFIPRPQNDWQKQLEQLIGEMGGAWDKDVFANRCAGCHSTAVETATTNFSAFGHDCYVCHGVVDLNHTGDTRLMLLSKKRRDGPEVLTSICAQCHLRGAKSQSTGLPYPNQFVPGDNLFKDYEVKFALADDASLSA